MASGDAALLEALGERLGTLGHKCEVRPGQGVDPVQLLVTLSPNDHGESLELQMCFLGDLSDPSVLQYYVGLPTRARAGAVANVTRFLNGANTSLPIGGFGVLEDQGLLFYRVNVPVVVDPLDVHLVNWTVKMVDYIVRSLGVLIEQLAMGLDYDLARRLLDETLSHLMEA
jgi:hypothetical protein